ncbi:MAG: T9SS type A sorting domain-containing protein [Adhaeribacter sp.]
MMQHLPDKQKKINYLRLFPAEKKFKIFLFFALTILLNTTSYFASAERVFPDMQLAVSNKGSDYYLTFDWNHLDVPDCDNRPLLEIYKNGTNTNNIFYSSSNPVANAGSMQLGIGPSQSGSWGFRYQEGNPDGGCLKWVWSGFPRRMSGSDGSTSVLTFASTVAIKNPTNVTASDQTAIGSIEIKWNKGTDIPDSISSYRIYRNGILVHTANGDQRSWKDDTVNPEGSYTYTVKTYSSKWGSHESSGVSVTGYTKPLGLKASNGEFHNRVQIEWQNISSLAEDIRIERSKPNSTTEFEELSIVNKNATSYSDYDGIPGFKYTYRLTPLAQNRNYASYTITGYRSPNGTIKGTVKSKLNAGVPGITITIKVKTANLTAGAGTYGAGSTYTTTTDSAGVYEVPGIYYYQSAEFYIVPTKNNHVFTPPRLTKKLDLNSPSIAGVDFTDETVYTLAGQIKYSNTTCSVKNVDIYLNGKNSGVKTDAQGKYALTVQDEGTYTITPKFLHHAFGYPGGTGPTRTVSVDGDVLNLDFTDNQTETMYIKVKNGCQETMGVATVRITSTDPTNCYNQTFTTNASGVLDKVLPAQAYNVEITDLANANKANILRSFSSLVVDMTQRDTLRQVINSDTTYTITPADTIVFSDGTRQIIPADTTGFTVKTDTLKTAILPKADFIYRGALTLAVTGLPDPVCSPQIRLMERGETRMIRIQVLETHGNTTCPVDSGTVTIYDRVGDKGVKRYPITNGEIFYQLVAGEPNPALPHDKLFEVVAQVGQRTKSLSYKITVTGIKPLTATFTSKTPELPFMVLHDPPGDGSYSFLAKDSTHSVTATSEWGGGGEAAVWGELKHGGGVTLPFIGKVGAAVLVNFDVAGGGDAQNKNAYTASFTASEQFATSASESYVGTEGDLIVGASMNIVYTKSLEVKYDKVNCTIDMDTTIIWDPTDFATTYVYTEKHIRNTLVPQLEDLLKVSKANNDELREEELTNSISVWKQVLKKNEENRNKAKFKENISFSAGASYDYAISTASDTVDTYEYSGYMDTDFLIGVEIGAGDWNETKFGVRANFRWNIAHSTETTQSKSQTIGYHLEDNDIGDFFSVDIGEDRVYGTPTFKTKAGTSLCPHEENTQPRFTPQIELESYSVSNVPEDKPATFTALISNMSESGEALEYDVKVVPTSNLDGAIIRLGGQQINQGPISYFIPAGETVPVTLTVERGPSASTYENLQIMMYPACELKLWQDGNVLHNSDTITFSAYFQSRCSEVSLVAPSNNWLIKQSDNNKIFLTLGNYDASNNLLKDIQIQYRKAGGEWLISTTIPKASLIEDFYGYEFDVFGLEDGNYEFRAKANCNSGAGFTYSGILSGIIDRATIAPFGIATPSDGFLRPGQEISVTFDKNLKPLAQYSTEEIVINRVTNGDTILVPTVATILNNNKLVIKTNPESLINSAALRGSELIATVSNIQDTNGNVQKYPVVWSFRVEKPVFWDPDTLIASVMVSSGSKIFSDLKNSSEVNKRFTITKYPSWLTPSVLKGVLLPNGFYKVEFAVNPELKPGVYKDVVEADIDGVKEIMPVTLELLAVPVAWQVNPANYNYTMNMVVQYTLSNPPSNLPTSADERDVIGAFVNGVPRGVAKIRKIEGMPGKYAAFLTIYSNDAGTSKDKEVINFRIWNALTGVEYGAIEKPNFLADNIIGSAGSPYILHPEGTFQVIPLKQGWNWVSLNVATPDMTVEKVFNSLVSSGNSITVKSQTQFSDYDSAKHGWGGSLKTVNLTSGYMVYLSDKPDTLRIVGTTPTTFTPVSLTGGWNWIGYPKIMNADIKTALGSTFAPKHNDFLKSFTSFATYTTPVNAWLGDLKTMDPGQSYKLKISAPASLTYRRKATDGSNFEVDEHQYEYTMTLTGMLNLNGMPVANDQYSVGAYINGVCRGFTQAEYMPNLKANRIFLTIYGEPADAGEIIEFRIFNSHTGEQIIAENKGVAFVTDKIVGAMVNPYLLNFNNQYLENGYALAQNKPNPFSASTTIEFTIPEEAPVELTLYDNLGKQIRLLMKEHKPAGNHTYILNAGSLASGIYSYQLKVGNYVKTRKLVIVR